MLYLTCTMISSVDLAHYGVSRAKDWVSADCGIISHKIIFPVSKISSRRQITPFKIHYLEL